MAPGLLMEMHPQGIEHVGSTAVIAIGEGQMLLHSAFPYNSEAIGLLTPGQTQGVGTAYLLTVAATDP